MNNYELRLIGTLKELLEGKNKTADGKAIKYCTETKLKEKYIEILKNDIDCIQCANFDSKKLLQELYAVLLNAFYNNEI